MDQNERIAMLYTMLFVADEQVKMYAERVKKLEDQCLKLQDRVNEIESQYFGGKVQ